MRDTALSNSIDYLINQASRALRRRFLHYLAQAELPITSEQWMILVPLWERDGLVQNTLATQLHKDKTTITRLLNTMEAHGLVRREPNAADRRQRLVFLTDRAKALQKPVARIAELVLEEAMEGMPKADVEACQRVLAHIDQQLQE
ncbi:MAG: MarR family winged helix-turn-helix transcriptional regulator [Rhodothermales bacterium]